MNMVGAWISAFRLRTLPLALSTVGMGSFLAIEHGVFDAETFAWTISTTILLQILSNLANDYGDTLHGADSPDRIGPKRAVQSGKITARQMKTAIIVFGALSFTSGIVLLIVSLGLGTKDFNLFLGFGILSILAAYSYTAGKRPYGYAGLGDIMVLIFFGILGVSGSFYLFAGYFESLSLLPALSLGLLATGVLNINNMRDRASDREAGKKTIPVRLGDKLSRYYHYFLVLGAIVLGAAYLLSTGFEMKNLLWLAGIPLLLMNLFKVNRVEKAAELDPLLRQLAIATFFYMLFFGMAITL